MKTLVVTVLAEDGPCLACHGTMLVQKTVIRYIVTLEHGAFVVRETVICCENRCQHPCGTLVTRRSESLAQLVAPGNTYGYDLEAFAGMARFVHHRQREEIRTELKDRYDIELSNGQVTALCKRFLEHLEDLHVSRAQDLRAALASDGGYPLHADATGEDGRGTLFVAYAAWRGWVLGAWKLPTERAEHILPCLQQAVALFGTPRVLMRDLGPAIIRAGEELAKELDVPLTILGCHLHFLRDIGKDLLSGSYNELKKLIGNCQLKSRMRAFVRDTGRRLGTQVDRLRADVVTWLGDSTNHNALPSGLAGLALIRSLAQWVLDYPCDGKDQGFPFDRPYFDLYRRGLSVHSAAVALLEKPPVDMEIRRALHRLEGILRDVADEKALASAATTLERVAALFDELRATLRLQPKSVEAQKTKSPPPAATEEEIAELNDVRLALDAYTRSLQDRRSTQGKVQETAKAIDIILAHLERHGSSLWGHAIALPASAGGCFRLVERTNNVLESFFHAMKHGERRRCGRKILTYDFECLPAAAALAYNLTKPDYVNIVCGSLDRLPQAFAALDTAQRKKTLASASPVQKATRIQEPQAATASMPRADRPIFRANAMRNFVDTVARRRPIGQFCTRSA